MQRYKDLAVVVEKLGVKFHSCLPFVDLLYKGKVVYHEVEWQERGRLDIITYRYLDDFSFWPIIGWYNGIIDPLSEITPGKILVIPVSFINKMQDIKAFTYKEVS